MQGKFGRGTVVEDTSVVESATGAAIGKHTRVEQINDFGLSVRDTPAGAAVSSIQRKATEAPGTGRGPSTMSGANSTEIASHGTAGNGEPLPHLGRIQTSFGSHDISGVKAHTDTSAGDASRALGAQAFAFGDSVAFASPPDLHTAAHEAAHVVQQRGGVQLKGGINQVGDPHERHADAVADAVVGGQSAEPLLDQMNAAPTARPVVQRKPANTTGTPEGLPDPVPAASRRPLAGEPHFDAEGNKIVEDGGHWHLAEAPKSLNFPIAGGYKYQLLPINPNAAYAALHTRVVDIQAEQLVTPTCSRAT